MNRYPALAGLVAMVLAPVWAQTNRVVVPARSSSRPRMVNVSLVRGSVTVKAYSGNEVIVEACREGSGGCDATGPQTSPAPGMHRLELPARGLEVEEEDNVVTVRMSPARSVELRISVPRDTSLNLKSVHGDIAAEGVNGEIDVNATHGEIHLTHVSGTVVAHALHGGITVSMDRLDPARPLSFSTLNGPIDVTLPADAKANVKFKAGRGEVYTDFEIALGAAGPAAEKASRGDSRFRVQVDGALQGTINGGGVEATFYTLNGAIHLRKSAGR